MWSISGAVIAHAGLIAWVLTLSQAPAEVDVPPPVIVSFAEIVDPPRMIEAAVDPEMNDETEVTESRPVAETPVSDPPSPPISQTPSQPTVLTQLESTDHPSSAVVAEPTGSEPVEVADPELIQSVIKNISCQRLTMRRDETCPPPDPFAIAAASEARQTAPPASPLLVGDYGPKTALERFASQQDRDPYLMPGMSADLFSEGLPSGAYNAQRIRNGQAPLWSKEIERGFTRDD